MASPVNPDAQAQFERGVTAFEEGRFRDAVELFKEADRLAPSAILSFNVAKVYERMSDNRSALSAYRDYLRRLPSAENRAHVSERVRELESSLAKLGVQQLTVLSTPEGATLSIDDVSRGVTPWTGELSPGRHQLALRLEQYQDGASSINLPADRAIDVVLELEPIPTSTPSAELAQRAETAPDRAVAPEPSTEPAPAASTPPTSAQADGARLPSWWTWTLFGASAASFAGAVGFELARSSMEASARRSQIQVEHKERYDAIQPRQTAARVFTGLGVVAALAGGASLYFDLEAGGAAPSDVAVACDATGCELMARGAF